MPTFEFLCLNCDSAYEDLTDYDESGKYKNVVCPHCSSKKKQKLMSACNFNFSNPINTKRWNSESTGHDYRYEYNKPKVRKEKEMARKMSHMGTKPYQNHSDIREGVHDSEGNIKLS